MDWIAEWITKKGWGRGNIGIELEAYYYSPKAHARLTAGLPNATFHDADLLVNWIRSVKSDAEIEYLRKAARLAEAAVIAAYDVIAPGVRECDAIARIQAAQVAGSPDFAGDIKSTRALRRGARARASCGGGLCLARGLRAAFPGRFR
jgi:Xaa-Pro aminopeptidase